MWNIHEGDCLEIMPTLPSDSVDCVITDPPYLTDDAKVEVSEKKSFGEIRHKTYSIGTPWGYSLNWVKAIAKFEPQHWIVFCNYRMLGGLIPEIEKYAKLGCVFTWLQSNRPPMTRNVPRFDCEYIVWAKHPKAKNGKAREFKSMILDVKMPHAGIMATERILIPGTYKAAHPTQKPLAIITPFIERFTLPDDTIIDPFMGSGSTGEACIKTGRRFIGIEKDAGYFAIAQKRLTEAAMRPALFDKAAD